MPVDPRVLQAIGDPTGGKLTGIGQIYAKSKQQAVENERSEQKMEMLRKKQEFDMAEEGSYAMGAYSKSIMDAVKVDPTLKDDPERMAELQKSVRDSFPEGYQQLIPEETQPYEAFPQGYNNAVRMQQFLHPTAPKTTFEMGSVQNIKTEEVRTRKKSDPYLEQLVKTNKWVEYHPSTAGTTGDIGTKKTLSNLQESQILAAEMQDDISELNTMWEDFGPEKMDWLSQSGDAAIRFMEKMGLPITEGMEVSSGQREKMKGRTKQLQTAWRLKVTGSQAGKWEIQDIVSQPLNMSDTISQWKVKLPAWKEKADRIAVRAKLAQQQGFVWSGETVKMSDGREMPTWTNESTGETKAITDFGALGAIPTMKEYMINELDKSYPDIDSMSESEVNGAIAEARRKANNMGYR